MIRYGFILMTFCLVAALVLSVTYKFTQPKIEAQVRNEEISALKEIFPSADNFKKASCGNQEYYRAESKNKLIGYVVKAKAKGYVSDIDMLIGVDLAGKISGVNITSQNETPGLGARVTEIKPGEDRPWFLQQFKGKSVEELNLNNIDAITAATITSEAVINGAKEQITQFLLKLNEK